MNLRHEKKEKVYRKVKKFFEDEGPTLIASYPALGDDLTEFNNLFATRQELVQVMIKPTRAITVNIKQIKDECAVSIRKLMAAMKYHYSVNGDKVGWSLVNVSRSKLSQMPIRNFFVYCQTVMGIYDPAICTPLGVTVAEMDALKLKLVEFPKAIQEAADGRLKRKNAVAGLVIIDREIDLLLKNRVGAIMDVADEDYPAQRLRFVLALKVGLPGVTTGKAHKVGTPEPAEVVVLNKAKYRSKLAIIVRNDGDTPLLAGRSANGTEIQGKPFIIEPGKTRKRISQKLGSKGQFIVLQNVGEGAGSFKVWMKE